MTRYGAMAALALSVVGLTRCRSKEVVLTQQERLLAAATGLQEGLLLEIKAVGRNLRQLEGTDSGGDRAKTAGVTIDVPHDRAASVVRNLQELAPPGHFAFVSERHFGFGGDPDQVSMMKAADPYEVILAMGTNGWNYDISPQMVITRLREWEGRYGLVFRGIAFDWVEAEFKTQPPDMQAFAREVCQFCPDVVDQGTETVEALAAEMKSGIGVYLWWD
jgi:hypothetical protein